MIAIFRCGLGYMSSLKHENGATIYASLDSCIVKTFTGVTEERTEVETDEYDSDDGRSTRKNSYEVNRTYYEYKIDINETFQNLNSKSTIDFVNSCMVNASNHIDRIELTIFEDKQFSLTKPN